MLTCNRPTGGQFLQFYTVPRIKKLTRNSFLVVFSIATRNLEAILNTNTLTTLLVADFVFSVSPSKYSAANTIVMVDVLKLVTQ